MLFKPLVLLSLATAAFAVNIGDLCVNRYGVGVCLHENDCVGGRPPSIGDCPNSPAWVKCCVGKACGSGRVRGNCRATNSPCAGGTGRFLTGLCPGPASIKCCVPNYNIRRDEEERDMEERDMEERDMEERAIDDGEAA